MRRVLMIAYYFPPLGGIASLRAARFAEHLPEFGWEPTVLAPRLGTHYEDSELLFPEERVIRSRSIELSRMGKRALSLHSPGDRVRQGRFGGARTLLRSAAHRFLYRPDPQIGWYPGAVHVGRRALEFDAFDAIFSTSVPMTTHLIGRRLQRLAGLPWIAEFRDPWSEKDASGDQARAAQLEQSIADAATELVMTSPSWAQSHAEKWGRPVTAIIAGADPVPRSATPAELVVTYLGSFYPDMQDLSAVWSALRRIVSEKERPAIRMRFIGELPTAIRSQLEQEGLMGLTEVTGYVSHRDALQLLSTSSVLLAAGPRDQRESLRGWIPAKLLEYLSTDLPIVYVSHTANDGADLLNRYPGSQVVAPDDPNGVVRAILASNGIRHERNIEGLSWSARARQLAELFDRSSAGR